MNAFRITLALLVVLLSGTLARAVAASPDDQKISSLLAQSRTALGGDALDRAGVIETEAKLSVGGLNGTARAWAEIGGVRFGESYSTPPLQGRDGYDGTDAWDGDGTGLVWIDGGQSGRSSEIDEAFASDYALWSATRGNAKIAWSGTKGAGGRQYDTLVVTPPNSAVPYELWIDEATHLPERLVLTIGPDSETTTFADYRPVAGVLIPYSQHTTGSDGNTIDGTVTQAVANAPDGVAHLTKPQSDVHDFSIAHGRSQTTIPFDLIENHVYLSVMLNGKGPYRFIFDTGGLNLIDLAVAKEIGATSNGSIQGGGVGSATESVSFANVSTLQVGDAVVRNQLFSVAPVRTGFGMTTGQSVDGLIGFEVLERFVTTFDYGANRVVLQLPGAAPPANADIVPFVLNGKQPQFPCGISGIASQCTLDTGARDSITLFSPFIAAHPQVVAANLTGVGVSGFGFGGAALGRLGRLASLAIGTFTIPNVVADFSVQQKGAFAQPFIAANVGGGVWKRFSLTLDYSAQTMALRPDADFNHPASYERAGLFLINHGGAYVVIDSRPGTPAAQAGIVKGDVIATIDGQPTSSMSLEQVRQFFFEAPGTVLQLGIVGKDGTKRTVTLTLRDYV